MRQYNDDMKTHTHGDDVYHTTEQDKAFIEKWPMGNNLN